MGAGSFGVRRDDRVCDGCRKPLEMTALGGLVRLESKVPPRWTRTINKLIKSQQSMSGKSGLLNDLSLPFGSVAHHLPADARQTEPGLAAVVDAWPHLPEAIRAGILAMVMTSREGSGHSD